MKLKENEKILLVIKSHTFTNIILGFFVLLFLFILGVIYYFLSDVKYIFLVLIILVQIFLVIFYYLLLEYKLNILVITNLRIIGIKKENFINKEFFEKNLSEIIEVKAKAKGFLANKFNFGKLEIFFKDFKTNVKYAPDVLKQAEQIMEIIKKFK